MPVLLCIVLIFCVWLSYEIKKHSKQNQIETETFWDREYHANFIRKSSAKDYNTELDFITIPIETLPFVETDDETLLAIQTQIKTLSTQKIVNLSGYSNTDLKYEYGTASITELSSFDENFTLLSRTLSKWGHYLYEKGQQKQAVDVFKYAVSISVDVSSVYKTLGTIYKEQGNIHQLEDLIETAKSLNSLLTTSLVTWLTALLEQ